MNLYLLIIYIYTNLLIGSAYFLFDTSSSSNYLIIIWLLWICVSIIIAIINIIYLLKAFSNNDINKITKYAYKIKISLFPYWILYLIITCIYWKYFFDIRHGFFLFISAIPILILSFIYGILYILLAWKNGIIKNNALIIHLFLQFCFILDIISIFILHNKKKGNINI